MSASPPVIGFELGVGEFRIVTPEAIYQIRVLPELVKANVGMGVVSPGAPARGGAPLSPGGEREVAPALPGHEGVFFQELSQELFDRVGQLARQLSISVTEIPQDGSDGLSRTGADLEDAKGQLEEVVEITEKASLKIMDLADLIQADVDNLNQQMRLLTSLEFLLEPSALAGSGDAAAAESSAEASPAVPSESGGDGAAFLGKFAELRSLVAALPEAGAEAAPAATAANEPAPTAPVRKIVFSLDVVFQTLYEFCTNETVKSHIKTMREDCGDPAIFDIAAIGDELSALAESVGEDDGLYNFPIPALLKILYNHANSEEHRSNFKKMNQTLASIFLDAVLPLEGEIQEAPAEAAPAAPAPEPTAAKAPGAEPNDGARLKSLVAEMGDLIAQGEFPGAAPAGPAAAGAAYTAILTKDRDAVVAAVAASDKLIQNTTSHLTHIMEALSFQDLSGQRIKKIVNLIGDIQVQLLSMLVAVDTKIKAHHDSPATPRPKEETEKVAQAEVDKMLEKLASEPSEMKGPGAENRLDQGAVNDLLSQLGF
ncbi:MAG: protein phosphatase CheZ [Deltaproteobacteria bacterium]|jgi:chemotaxis regulatin CheY-phosphate phosphatase CheZ|nr:protein phosphatase CheZ [Deltaproteobacteria bacterium]